MRGIQICLLLLAFTPARSEAQRLPLLAIPEHYALRFAPDLASETFEGTARIRVRVLQPTTTLVLNAADLRFGAVTIGAGGETQTAEVAAHAEAETVTFRVPAALPAGPAELDIAYSGTLNRQLRGFYISEANDRKYAVTQLEATDARRMFPSFDEPQFKATFDVTAVVAGGDYAISNGPLLGIDPGPAPGQRTFRFATTARMSTYLVALAVGDFECVEGRAGDTPLRVCATPGKRELTTFALEATQALLEYFNEYFAIDYPFAKLDQVAIPDFAAGAMENTGAIFYRESILLVDPEDASLDARKRAALVIAHEIAHHWFGNLVTMEWWDDLWLNEGFATWMEAKAVDAWKPDWHIRLDQVQSVQGAMALDALAATRPVRLRAETPAEINELFDPIAYEKAAAILTMVESYVGDEDFRGGVNGYLDMHEYDNATAENFWTIMTRATGDPVDRIMTSFVTQPGFPVVSVDADCRNGTGTVTLAQQRYRRDAAAAADSPASQTWAIPMCLRVPDGNGEGTRAICELLTDRTETVALDRCVPWVAANPGAHGYYRVAYTDALLRGLAAAERLTPAEAIMLLANQWALVRSGQQQIGGFLDVGQSLARHAESAAVAESLGARLRYVHEYLTTPSNVEQYEAWVRTQLGPVLERMGAEPGARAHDQPRYRAALMKALGIAGRAPAVLRTARRAVDDYLTPPSTASIDPMLLDAYVVLAATSGDGDLYDRYLARSRKADTPEERYRFLYALADFRDPKLLARTIELALSDAVRSQDRAGLIAAVLGNPAGRDLAWKMIQQHWADLEKTLAGFGGSGRIVDALGAFCDAAHLREIRDFFAAHPTEAERTLRQTVERIESCVALRARQQSALDRWLAAARAERR